MLVKWNNILLFAEIIISTWKWDKIYCEHTWKRTWKAILFCIIFSTFCDMYLFKLIQSTLDKWNLQGTERNDSTYLSKVLQTSWRKSLTKHYDVIQFHYLLMLFFMCMYFVVVLCKKMQILSHFQVIYRKK